MNRATDPVMTKILFLLCDVEKDDAIARELEISTRTCRRFIAEFMAMVGAKNRFQAGVIAARDGWLDGQSIGVVPHQVAS